MFSKGSMWMMSRDSNFSFWLGNWTKSRCGKTGGSGRVGFRSDRVNRVACQVGSRDGLSLPVFFKQVFFFFFEIDAIYQLFLNSLTLIRFSLVILLPLTDYY